MSRGQLFKYAAHDDLYGPEFLEQCVRALDADPDLVLSHCSARFVGPDGTPLAFDTSIGAYRDPRGRPLVPEHRYLGEAATPSKRFHEIVHGMRWCFALYGVARTDAIRRAVHPSFYGADKVLLAELSLLGRFHEIDEPLFVKRVHLGMSVYLAETNQQAFMDPESPRRPTQWRKALFYLAAVRRAPLKWSERLRCLGSILTKQRTKLVPIVDRQTAV